MKESLEIKGIMDYIKKVEKRWKEYSDKVDYCNKYEQDLLHKLENENLTSEECAKTAEHIRKNRKERRMAKNMIELLQPIRTYIEKNQKVLNSLGQLLGEVRKIEAKQDNWTYVPKLKEKKSS